MKLAAGSAEDRLAGLDRPLAVSRGATVLDISFHNGGIAASFAAAGCAVIDGVDIWKPGVALAAQAVSPYRAECRFAICDLIGGMPAVRRALSPMPSRYDIVLYLGIHQHLERQMEPDALGRLVRELVAVTGSYFAIRVPKHTASAVYQLIQEAGFAQWYRDFDSPSVGGLTVYKRAPRNAPAHEHV